MDNIKLLDYSILNKEQALDPAYMFIEKDRDLPKYVEKTKKIKNILIAIKEVSNKKSSTEVIATLFADLKENLKDFSQFSEFSCFINACDSSLNYATMNEELLKKITAYYLQKRDLNEFVPSEWIQALIDKTSSRKKGQVGEVKLINILKKSGYCYTENYLEFIKAKKSVACFRNDFTLKNIKKNLKISIGKDTQSKKLDLCIKKGKEIYFLEAKHVNNEGGEQNKQVLELIKIIQEKNANNHYHYVSFLDGLYFDLLFKSIISVPKKKSGENKLLKQQKDIRKALKNNRNNYFVNTAGFKKLFG
ncbi:MAG TPA: DpnII family type II restriction endonuclease [Candidatus Paceibacterota bacterium]|nr:DpnII family type II restriction endonuclease [Candidatus Pacearchaeota archaeon]HRZ50764.1 DpnII family type II restriction endonuclease [Candidatus Paceibacterota bacterium]HSA36339.1 DpnII family type II restriction endonuclease [Candidatus Paceibacterota bacterium]